MTLQVDKVVRSLILGTQENIMDKADGALSSSDAIVYIIFVIALYHYVMYLSRRKNKVPLYFTIMATGGGFYQLCANSDIKSSESGLTYLLISIVNAVDFDLRGILWTGSTVILCVGTSCFLLEIFSRLVPQRLYRYYNLYIKAFIIFYFVYMIPNFVNVLTFFRTGRDGNKTVYVFYEIFGEDRFESIMHVFDIIFTSQILVLLFVGGCFISFTLLNNHKSSRIVAFSFSLLGITAFNDILNNFRIIETGRWVSFGLMTFIFTQAIAISKYFAEAFNDAEDTANKNIELNKEILVTQKEIILVLGEIAENHSGESAEHIYRVAEYSAILAQKYGLPNEEIELIKLVSPMHDIGKLGIPDSILNKPGKLTEEEFEIIKTHTQVGHDMLNKSNRDLMKIASIIAYQHHERYNGKGYPNGLKGKEIHIYGRITAIADVFDALVNKRVYKEPWEIERVIELFKEEKGQHFDPDLTDIFLENIDEITLLKNKFT